MNRQPISPADLQREVERAVSQRIASSSPFTARDITWEVRKQPTIANVYEVEHDMVRPLVQDMMMGAMNSGYWGREYTTVGTQGAKAYLYSPKGDTTLDDDEDEDDVPAAPVSPIKPSRKHDDGFQLLKL